MEDITIRSESPTDYTPVRHLHSRAFTGGAEVQLVERLRSSDSFIPELSLVAEEGGQVVGHVLFSRARIEGMEDARVLVLGPVGVLPERQRQGVGSALIREGLQRAAGLGYRGVALIGHPTYYPRFGFRPGSRFGLRSTYEVPDDVFMALSLAYGALEGVGGLLRYPPEFAGL